MTVLYTPMEVVKKLENIFFTFLWGKCHKIKKTTITQQYNYGGLNMVDMEAKMDALKVSWIPKLLSNDSKISNIVSMYLASIHFNIQVVLKTSFRTSDSFCAIKKLPKFYQQIFISLNRCKTIKPINKLSNFEFLIQPIWGNEYFKFKKKIYTAKLGLKVKYFLLRIYTIQTVVLLVNNV